MPRILHLQPLTAEAFRPFGDVIDPPALGARRALGDTLVARDGANQPALAFNHGEAVTLPLLATQMERHNRSCQCFVPMDVSRWVVMVAPDRAGKPDMAGVIGFIARGDQAVNYHLGRWHHPLRVLDRPGRFAILMWSTGRKSDDEEWATLEEPLLLQE